LLLLSSQRYAKVEALVKLATGCERVVVLDHTTRESGSAAGLNADSAAVSAAPVSRVHCDYTDTSGPKRAAEVLLSNEFPQGYNRPQPQVSRFSSPATSLPLKVKRPPR
jgi:hypothetical protein